MMMMMTGTDKNSVTRWRTGTRNARGINYREVGEDASVAVRNRIQGMLEIEEGENVTSRVKEQDGGKGNIGA